MVPEKAYQMTVEMIQALIRKAFENAQLPLVSLSANHYSADVFGSFLTIAETGSSRLKITYDRGFIVQTVGHFENHLTDDILASIQPASINQSEQI